jgi:peptidoglycan/LPS O-acetylase OafA/YrhL
MTNALSLYLDALRFGAALTVFVSHYPKSGS